MVGLLDKFAFQWIQCSLLDVILVVVEPRLQRWAALVHVSAPLSFCVTLNKLPKFPTEPSLHLGNDGINLDFTKCTHFLFCVTNHHTFSSSARYLLSHSSYGSGVWQSLAGSF